MELKAQIGAVSLTGQATGSFGLQTNTLATIVTLNNTGARPLWPENAALG